MPAPALLAGWYVCASLACFIAYARDKRAAITGRRRTPERTLLLLGLIGGWPGGLLAQRLVRHKSAKTSFQVKFWITVALHGAAVATLLIDVQWSPAWRGQLLLLVLLPVTAAVAARLAMRRVLAERPVAFLR